VVGGASIAQQLLGAGLVDELHVDIMPVLLGIGRRSGSRKINMQEVCAGTSLRFPVMQWV
jgi:dihydrofolate reductase